MGRRRERRGEPWPAGSPGRAVETAVGQLWKDGRVDAIVTGPGDKRALNAAGYRFPGHTELLRELTGARQVAMMLASDRLRVVLVTTHLALRDALSILTPERIVDVGRVTRTFLHRGSAWRSRGWRCAP